VKWIKLDSKKKKWFYDIRNFLIIYVRISCSMKTTDLLFLCLWGEVLFWMQKFLVLVMN